METGRSQAPAGIHDPPHAAAGLANVVRGAGTLRGQPLVRTVSASATGRIAGGACPCGTQSLPRSHSPLRPRAAVPVSLHKPYGTAAIRRLVAARAAW